MRKSWTPAWKATGIGAVVVALAVGSAIWPGVAMAVTGAVLALGIRRWPRQAMEAGVLLALTIRPWVDAFSERRLGLGVFALNPAVLLGLAVLAIAVISGINRAREGNSLWPVKGLGWAHIWLCAAYTVATLAGWGFYGAVGASEGGRELVRVASIIAAFLLVLWWVREDASRYRRGWFYLVAGCALPVVVGVWQWITGSGFLETAGFNRVQGTFSHPNSFGQYLIPFIAFGLAAVTAPQARHRVLLAAVTALLTWLSFLTYSRTVVLVLAATLVSFVVLRSRYRVGIGSLVWSSGFIAMFGIVTWLLAGNVIRERFANVSLGRSAVDAALSGASENSYEWRLINWSVLIRLGMEHPVVGHGAGMTTVLNPIVNSDNGVPFNAHNDFVRFFFEGGVLGLTGYLLYVLLLCGWVVRRALRSSPNGPPWAAAIASAWVGMLFLTAGNTELSLHTADLFALYGMLALTVGREDPNPNSLLAGARTLANDPRWS